MTVTLHSDILQGIVIMTGNMGPLGIGFALQLAFLLHKQHPQTLIHLYLQLRQTPEVTVAFHYSCGSEWGN